MINNDLREPNLFSLKSVLSKGATKTNVKICCVGFPFSVSYDAMNVNLLFDMGRSFWLIWENLIIIASKSNSQYEEEFSGFL